MAGINLQLLGTPNPLVVDLSPMSFPRTLVLRSQASTRAIKLSVDGGIEFFSPTYDVQSATSIACTVTAPVTTVQFTGTSGTDLWGVL